MAKLSDILNGGSQRDGNGSVASGDTVKQIETATSKTEKWRESVARLTESQSKLNDTMSKIASQFGNASKKAEEHSRSMLNLNSAYLKASLAITGFAYVAKRAFDTILAAQKPLIALSVNWVEGLEAVKRALVGISNVPLTSAAKMVSQFQELGPQQMYRFGRDQRTLSGLTRLQSELGKVMGAEAGGALALEIAKSFGTDSRAFAKLISDMSSKGIRGGLEANAGATGTENLWAVSKALNALELASREQKGTLDKQLGAAIEAQRIEDKLNASLEQLYGVLAQKLEPLLKQISDKWLPLLTSKLEKLDLGKLWDEQKWTALGLALGYGFLKVAGGSLLKGGLAVAGKTIAAGAGAVGAGAVVVGTAGAVAIDELGWNPFRGRIGGVYYGDRKDDGGALSWIWRARNARKEIEENERAIAVMRQAHLAQAALPKTVPDVIKTATEKAIHPVAYFNSLLSRMNDLAGKANLAREQAKAAAFEDLVLPLQLAEAKSNLAESQRRRASALFGNTFDVSSIAQVNASLQKQIDLLERQRAFIVGTGEQAQIQRIQTEQKIVDLQAQQLSNLGAMGKSYLDVLEAKATDAGRFNKLLYTQDRNLQQSLERGMARANWFLGSVRGKGLDPMRLSGDFSQDIPGIARRQGQELALLAPRAMIPVLQGQDKPQTPLGAGNAENEAPSLLRRAADLLEGQAERVNSLWAGDAGAFGSREVTVGLAGHGG